MLNIIIGKESVVIHRSASSSSCVGIAYKYGVTFWAMHGWQQDRLNNVGVGLDIKACTWVAYAPHVLFEAVMDLHLWVYSGATARS